ncbi:hypothetical protein HK104_005941 [Borealophlyctis nickersoniae]|nr:hypothetical protein HK104_005941 [Borealophlyctis nickersoniae]
MKFFIASLALAAGVNAIVDVNQDNLWAGKPIVEITRDGRASCSQFDGFGVTPAQNGVTYDSWTRSRATNQNLCFQVWSPGVTDKDGNPWQQLDVQVHYRYRTANATNEYPPYKTAYVNWVGRAKDNDHNAVYQVPLALEYDPMYWPKCIDPSKVTCGTDASGNPLYKSTFEYFFTVYWYLAQDIGKFGVKGFTIDFVSAPFDTTPEGCALFQCPK